MEHDQIEIELQRLHPETFGWALACCNRNRSDAEDVMQKAYVKVLEGSARFDAKSSFRTWLFGVVRHTAAEKRRRSAVQDRLLKLLLVRRVDPETAGPERAIDYSARSQALVNGMKRLSRRQAEVLQLVFYHEMTIEQAARVLGLSIGSARTHYARGKNNLRRVLQTADKGNEGNDQAI